MWSRRRRAAISQSEVRKRCKLYGPIAEGYRAYQRGCARMNNPYLPLDFTNRGAWQQGWNMAEDKQREKDNDSSR